ncbi:ankyrin repeat domain-containing protein 54-like [Penaeus japonicus]|uniref:ankyrin repeat domain-containing protein 54-like n=1 Tax=Penaeus japonicus TaxID=27405 RepID=UPI001C7162A3|nr:ankyrin repeat domain-containing protein 54-like [Penaeus japonicus]
MQLLYHEANPESRTGDGKTALHLAAEYGNLKAVRWLLGKDFDPNVRDGSDCTPVDYARKERNTKIHEYLLRWRHYMQEKSSVRKYEVENERLRRTQVQQRTEIERMKSEIEKLKRENQVLSAIIATPERAVAD